MTPSTLSQIELAWWEKGRAIDIALRFKGFTWRQVARIWATAKAQGRLPNIKRPAGGFDLAQMYALRCGNRSEESHFRRVA